MGDPARVLLLTQKMSPAAGGLSVSVPGLAKGLDFFDDLEVHVMGALDPNDPAAAQKWGPRVQAFPVSAPTSLQRAIGMAPALDQLAPDLVDVQGLFTWASYVSLSHWRRNRKPYVVTPRGMLDPWARRNSAWKKRLFAAFAETAHLRHAHCLRATAQMEAQHFRDMGLRAPIAIVPNSIHMPELKARKVSARRKLLFLSRIHPKKGLSILLQAWATLEDRHPGWDLIIAGIDENGHEAELKAQARHLGLARVGFPGAVHGAAKDALYRSSDIFLLPTHSENFGLVVAEALAQEVPVITTINTPWEGLERHNCGWRIALNPSRFADTMEQAMAQPREELWAMGAHGRNWMSRDYSPTEVATRMREVYLWCMGYSTRPDHVYE